MSAAEGIYPSYETCNLVPDYDTLQPCIDSRRRATVFAKVDVGSDRYADPRETMVETGGDRQVNPREILRIVCEEDHYSQEYKISASMEFQFVLRNLSDGNIHLPKGEGAGQKMVQKLAQALHDHRHNATGLSLRSSDISTDGAMTIALSPSDNALEPVDNYYRVKRALQSIASLEGLRPSFFYASEDVSGAAFSGTSLDVMCENRLRCRLYLALGSGWKVCDFAANIMAASNDARCNPSIYAFSKPNWLTYAQRRQYWENLSPERKWMTWGVRNSKTTINLPEGFNSRRLEFGDIYCMANIILQARNVDKYDPDRTGSLFHPETQRIPKRIPKSGLDACASIGDSARLYATRLSDIKKPYLAVWDKEDQSIVKAVADGRATSARELLGE